MLNIAELKQLFTGISIILHILHVSLTLYHKMKTPNLSLPKIGLTIRIVLFLVTDLHTCDLKVCEWFILKEKSELRVYKIVK